MAGKAADAAEITDDTRTEDSLSLDDNFYDEEEEESTAGDGTRLMNKDGWNMYELRRLLEGLRHYGEDLTRLRKLVKTKSKKEIASYLSNCREKLEKEEGSPSRKRKRISSSTPQRKNKRNLDDHLEGWLTLIQELSPQDKSREMLLETMAVLGNWAHKNQQCRKAFDPTQLGKNLRAEFLRIFDFLGVLFKGGDESLPPIGGVEAAAILAILDEITTEMGSLDFSQGIQHLKGLLADHAQGTLDLTPDSSSEDVDLVSLNPLCIPAPYLVSKDCVLEINGQVPFDDRLNVIEYKADVVDYSFTGNESEIKNDGPLMSLEDEVHVIVESSANNSEGDESAGELVIDIDS